MSGVYKARGGESWGSVARLTTGIDTDAATIQRANPGVSDPIPEGMLLQIPAGADPEPPAVTADGTSLICNGSEIGTYDVFSIATSIDAVSKCGFTIPNEPEMRELFTPLQFPGVTVDIDGAREFTGRAMTPVYLSSGGKHSMDILCFSRPGLLELVPPPLSAFPWEYTNANLSAIAHELCAYHGVPVRFDADSGPTFDRVDIRPNDKIFSFLSGLATQRGPLLSSSPAGELVFWEETTPGNPVDRLEHGAAPVESIAVQVNEDRYYSDVSGWVPSKPTKGDSGARYTMRNPHAVDLVRPYSFEVRDVSPGELTRAVEIAAGRMFAGVYLATVQLMTSKDRNGERYRPNTTIEMKAPRYHINDFYEFLITDVIVSKSNGVEKTSLNLALPGVFSGRIPEAVPWM